MRYYDVFNGDADGLCALLQMRLAKPVTSQRITGVKRDIQLLQHIDAQAGDSITVLDISLLVNQKDVARLLAQGAHIFYCDHHQAGELPRHPHFSSKINSDANVCTSLLINGHLQGRYPLWAIVGAFGDNLQQSAAQLAQTLCLTQQEVQQLEHLGKYLNYNAYGESLADLHWHPATLYDVLSPYSSPLDFIAQESAVFEQLAVAYQQDMHKTAELRPYYENAALAVYILPDAAWARRVSGVLANQLANANVNKAHAVLSLKNDGNYQVSVRAPLNNKQGAAAVCSQFETGGGREAAAGINQLPESDLQRFIDAFNRYYVAH